jgi:hypothetical protein
MFIRDVLLALVIALLFTAIFVGRCCRRGPWASLWTFFVILFLATWAGGLWITPFGPLIFGIYWMPFLLIGLLVALLLAAAEPVCPPRTTKEAVEQAKEEIAVERTINAFFWVLAVMLGVFIMSAYLLPRVVF